MMAPISPEGGPVLALILGLVLLWVVLAVVGLAIKGLLWLAVVAGVLFLLTLVLAGAMSRRRRPLR
jgi:hypothetical protein